MTNRKKVTFSKKKITFHDHGYISDNDYFHEQASDPTQFDHELGEPIDQDYLEEDENKEISLMMLKIMFLVIMGIKMAKVM
jgi:hypothetical protein